MKTVADAMGMARTGLAAMLARLPGRQVLLAALWLACAPAMAQVDVDAFIKKDTFRNITISPTGEYYAATVPFEDRTGLVILRRSDNKVTANIALGKNTHVQGFWWVNPNRILYSLAEKLGSLDNPSPTGELYAVNADGSGSELLIGYRLQTENVGSRLPGKKAEEVAAFLVDDLPGDDKDVIISVSAFSAEAFTRAERMDVYNGRRTTIARVPVRRASFTTDHQGVVRFAVGAGSDNVSKLYYRGGEAEEWKLINDEAVTNRIEVARGFSRDGKTAYLQVEHEEGPDSIVAYDLASGARKELLRDKYNDPWLILGEIGSGSAPVGVVYVGARTHTAFFDDASPEARLYRSLEASFPDQSVYITSTTADGKLALVSVSSASEPGEFYVFNIVDKSAKHMLSRRSWFGAGAMAEVRSIMVKARDGLELQGYLTLPKGGTGKQLPTIILPHGGPFGIFDEWAFDADAQMLASAGYAVLQVNFRGSGNRGRAFQHAGAREWGGKMQDDLTDATRWAIQEGIADPGRICIYGASYGGYAALVGVAKEPALYKCAVGYVGVYDLPKMVGQDSRESRSFDTFAREWVGEGAALDAASATNMAGSIKVPVFLAAGGEDYVAPIAHSKKMESALREAGVPVETLYYSTEGHGFYQPGHRREYYVRLLEFLSRHLGGAKAK